MDGAPENVKQYVTSSASPDAKRSALTAFAMLRAVLFIALNKLHRVFDCTVALRL